ncbi:nucleotide disphospho-sugar-binding domain-containing protein [Methylocapsa palsarum]|uniref:Glycosyltransferase, MGT family n=1 Tax=Methylocapsa palsarum TaxID=1612308 RepID=A0A1I4AR44_9HYPH|nr:glycosyltransferase [Methylocapsa palsarum]SFK58371.1 glycosyltransferase, MGT family [Methylocapsa palsarum]
MARVAFFTWPIFASVESTVRLARDLSARGHKVSYLGPPECAQYVASHGFPITPLYQKWLPTSDEESVAERNVLERLQAARAMVRRARDLLDAIGAGRECEFQEIMARLKPDLLLINMSDFEAIIPSLLAYESDVTTVYLYDNYSRSENAVVPPVTTSIIPESGWRVRLQAQLAWKILKARRRVAGYFLGWAGLSYETDLLRTSRLIASRCGYPEDCIESTDALSLKARFPEIVLCPRELDFPHPDQPGRRYLDSGIDLHRPEADFPWDRLQQGRRIIYCALGTLIWREPAAYKRFFQVVIDVAATRASSQWVIALCDSVDPEDFKNVPPNVILVKRAPQLAMLKKCAVAIVHGGANTIKECAYFGVPMIVFPLGFDHPGNAARVVYHGLGLRADFAAVSERELNALIDRIDRDPLIQTQALAMGETLRNGGGAGPAVDFLEMLLACPPASQSDDDPDAFAPRIGNGLKQESVS